MEIRDIRLIIPIIFCIPVLLLSQNKASISGFVFDRNNKETVIGANVYLQELPLGSSTNQSGYYIITDIPRGNYTLICDYVGYERFQLPVSMKKGEKKRINIFLKEQTLTGKTIVVAADSVRIAERLFREPISKIDFTPREIKKIPQVAEADLLRSLQTLPGIVPVSDFSSALYVRGGTPDQNLYMIDGADVYNPEHAFGLFSTFNTDAIKHVDFSKGGFGARYGGRLSSIMDVTYLDGNRERFEGTASVSLLAAKTTLQMPLGKSGSISGSVRRTYFDKTVAPFIDNIPNYYFYDANLKAYFDLNADNKLSLSFFGGRDVLNFRINEKNQDSFGFDYDWGNSTASLLWTRVFTPRLFSRFWITGSRFSSHFKTAGGFDILENNKIDDLTLKGYLEYAKSSRLFFKTGFEQKNIHGTYYEEFPGGLSDVNRYVYHTAAFVETEWKPTRLWDMNIGLRYNYFNSERTFQNVAPRFALKYRLTETSNLKFASGVYYQYLHRIPRGFFTSLWTTSDKYQGASRAYHLISGYQKELSRNFSLDAEVYYKKYHHIYAYNHNALVDLEPVGHTADGRAIYGNTKGLFLHGNGQSVGLEVLLKKDNGPVSGWLGYSLAHTQYTFDGINRDKPFAPRHDRLHTINLVAHMDVNRSLAALRKKVYHPGKSRWLISLNLVYMSGQPLTVPSSAYLTNYFPDLDSYLANTRQGGEDYSIYPSAINAYRLPYYGRIDLSITYEKKYASWQLSPYLQIYNTFNRQNVWFIRYTDESTGDEVIQKPKTIYMLPFLPTIGVTVTF